LWLYKPALWSLFSCCMVIPDTFVSTKMCVLPVLYSHVDWQRVCVRVRLTNASCCSDEACEYQLGFETSHPQRVVFYFIFVITIATSCCCICTIFAFHQTFRYPRLVRKSICNHFKQSKVKSSALIDGAISFFHSSQHTIIAL
jgi:hypothetical protein